MHSDGLAYVKEEAWADIYNGVKGGEPVLQMATGLANVPEHLIESAIESADDCPGECIYLSYEE